VSFAIRLPALGAVDELALVPGTDQREARQLTRRWARRDASAPFNNIAGATVVSDGLGLVPPALVTFLEAFGAQIGARTASKLLVPVVSATALSSASGDKERERNHGNLHCDLSRRKPFRGVGSLSPLWASKHPSDRRSRERSANSKRRHAAPYGRCSRRRLTRFVRSAVFAGYPFLHAMLRISFWISATLT
jgi:hypothetical protein